MQRTLGNTRPITRRLAPAQTRSVLRLQDAIELLPRAGRRRAPTSGARALRGAADARADAGEGLVVTEHAAGVGVGVGEAGLNGLAHVDLVGEVIPGGRVGETVDE